MAKAKGPKRAKTLFTVARIERKQTRHLTGSALAEWAANKAAAEKKKAEPKKAEPAKA